MTKKHILSKSTFLRGLQCHKSLYLNRYRRDLRDEISPEQQAVFATGREVGELARGLFPGGVQSRPPNSFQFQRAVEVTRELIDGGKDIIYEAAFQHEQVLALVDILVREGDRWRAYEVKSSASVKDVHIPDAGIQYYIMRGQGIELADLSIVHLNTSYVRQGELDLEQLFTIVSVYPQVLELQPELPDLVAELKGILAGGMVPEVPIGPQCTDPYDCDFIGYCWSGVPEYSVFNVARLSKKKAFGLYREGIVRTVDVPDDYPLGDTAAFQVQRDKDGRTTIADVAVQAFLQTLNYPLYYLDFETFNPAIPPFDGTRPYRQIPYQYSLHKKESPTADLEHTGFLAEAGIDPRLPLIESMLSDLEGPGDIVVYSGFEAGRIKDLAEQFPEHSEALLALLERIVDLMQPFKDRAYYAPEMHGSYSIKAVLPALVPDLSYEGLVIKDGGEAMRAYYELAVEKNPDRIEAIRHDLWEYCKLDSLAMVRILEKLESL
ncbi:MAG: DUF2779 domain-containing protein [Anaerolineae bacterium]|nr:MAG: DUF2779 domain-containing protein [Anaerolineae bacterium]